MGASRSARAARSIIPLLLFSAFSHPAAAGMLAFDFDTDADPGTVDNTVEAEVGEIVEAYLVLSSLPVSHPWLKGVEFGLELTDGLSFVGMSAPTSGALYLQDGIEGIAVAFGHDVDVEELPVFIMRFALQVTASGVQSVEVVPSSGFGHTYTGFVLTLAEYPGGEPILLQSYLALLEQRRGLVNEAATPNVVCSWADVKGRFARVRDDDGE